jgi:hypothetical protein
MSALGPFCGGYRPHAEAWLVPALNACKPDYHYRDGG